MMAQAIGQRYPAMAAYARGAGVDTPWCGIFNAYVHMLEGVAPAYSANGSDYDDFMWADAPVEGNWGTKVTQATAKPGDTVVLRVPHHITFLDKDNGDGTFNGVGGNQSEAGTGGGVTTSRFKWANIRAVVRAPGSPDLVGGGHPEIKLGSSGPAVTEAQRLLGIAQTGEFDEAMDGKVRAYQASRGLLVDGEVGDDTWAALTSHAPVVSDVPHAAEYRQQWDTMVILPEHQHELEAICRTILENKERYQAAEAATGVPWYMIAAIHNRESSLDFTRQLAQGDPLHSVSTHVPAGRGPFSTWEAGVHDALVTLKHLDKVVEWPVEQIANKSEVYNGPGYRSHGVPSAYLWSFSNIYRGGKYIHDGPTGWSPTTFDKQAGCMVVIRQLMALDHTIHIDQPPPPDQPPPEPDTHRDNDTLTLVVLLLISILKEQPMSDPKSNDLIEKVLPALLQILAQRNQPPRATGSPTDIPLTTTGQPAPDPFAGLLVDLVKGLIHRDPPAPAPVPVPWPADKPLPLEPEVEAETKIPSATAQAASVDLRTTLGGLGAYLAAMLAGLVGTPAGPEATLTGQLTPILIMLASAVGLPSWAVSALKLAPALFSAVGKAKAARAPQ